MENPEQSTSSQNDNCGDKSFDDSGYIDSSVENPLLLTSEDEQQSLCELNNRLANYIDHMRQQELTAKSNKSIEELIQIPSIQLENLKSLYESEIKSLRDALDRQSNDMATVTVQNNKLMAENGNINRELGEKILQVQQLSDSLQKSESENAYLKIQINLLKKSQDLVNSLSEQLKTCQDQLEIEVLLRAAAENACLTYKEKIEFNEAVFRKELGALITTHKSTLASMTSLKNDITSSNLLGHMEEARSKLRDYLNEFRNSIDDNFLDTINKAARKLGDQVTTRSHLQLSNDELRQAQHNLTVELEKVKASHIKMENHLSDLETLNEGEINRLRRIISELSDNKLDDLTNLFHDLNDSFCTQVPLNAELCIYRKMLDSEAVRTDFSHMGSPLAKRRKADSESKTKETTRKILKATRHEKTCAIM